MLSLFETLCHGLRYDIANARGYSVAFLNSAAAVFNYRRFALERVFIHRHRQVYDDSRKAKGTYFAAALYYI